MSTTSATTQQAVLLEAQGLSYGYANAPRLFEEVSFTVGAGEVVCLLGSSGCGKSTLLRLLAGLEQPASGHVQFLGQDLTAPHPKAALLFQQPGLLPWLDVRRNVGFGLDFKRQAPISASQLSQRVERALASVGLRGQGDLRTRQLSGGMAQRVALARALAREPQLLLADEPFSALDAITRTQMQDLMVQLVHEWQTAVLLVTHDIDEALRVADRIFLLGRAQTDQAARLLREWTVPRLNSDEAQAQGRSIQRAQILDVLQSHHLSHQFTVEEFPV